MTPADEQIHLGIRLGVEARYDGAKHRVVSIDRGNRTVTLAGVDYPIGWDAIRWGREGEGPREPKRARRVKQEIHPFIDGHVTTFDSGSDYAVFVQDAKSVAQHGRWSPDEILRRDPDLARWWEIRLTHEAP